VGLRRRRRFGSLRGWTIGGRLGSALALLGLVLAGIVGPPWPLRAWVLALGVCNDAFAVAAIGSMMELAGRGRAAREGVRMGMWGAAQAVGFALGGFAGTAAVDLLRQFVAAPATAYALVFAAQALLFLVSAVLAARVGAAGSGSASVSTAGAAACAAGLGGR
jgi:BCD family chlorophyll transporter-like MFS transporter